MTGADFNANVNIKPRDSETVTSPKLTPLTESAGDYQLIANRGVMRMLLMGALADANLWTRATGASQDTKNHWARRGNLIRELLAAMSAPENPRDPFEDLPGEPTPEEAAAKWAEQARGEDARRDARVAAEKVADGEEWSTEMEVAAAAGMLEPSGLGDDLAGLLG